MGGEFVMVERTEPQQVGLSLLICQRVALRRNSMHDLVHLVPTELWGEAGIAHPSESLQGHRVYAFGVSGDGLVFPRAVL